MKAMTATRRRDTQLGVQCLRRSRQEDGYRTAYHTIATGYLFHAPLAKNSMLTDHDSILNFLPASPSPPWPLALSCPYNRHSTYTLWGTMPTTTSRLRHAATTRVWSHRLHFRLLGAVPRLQLSRPVRCTWVVSPTYLASAQWIWRTRPESL